MKNKKNNRKEKIPTLYFFAIDPSKYKSKWYFKAVVLNRKNNKSSFEPLYKSVTKEEYLKAKRHTPYGKIIFENKKK